MRKIIKRKMVLCFTVAIAMTLFLCACKSGSELSSSTWNSSQSYSEQESSKQPNVGSSTSSSTKSNSDIPDSSDNDTSVEAPSDKNVIGDITAKELVEQMRVGWNLGNTLDATGGSGLGAETSWGNIKTTKANIDAIKAAGFNVLRVPVSWGTHLDENYSIDSAWMDRVQEIVDYGIDNDMFVILNTHHEEWYLPTADHIEHDLAEIEAVWKQIAEHFESYGEKLIFEGLNEPRLRGDSLEWYGDDSARGIVNRYAEKFVATVRATGGNNKNRILMVTPYCASSSDVNLKALKIPESSGKIIVSVHAYIPYPFALDASGTSEFNAESNDIKNLFAVLKNLFIDKGIPVIIGEFGAVNKNNLNDRITWVKHFLDLGKQYGIPCVWWDNGQRSGNGENFALFNRADNTWHFPELVDAIMSSVN